MNYDLSTVSVLIKTLGRDTHLTNTVNALLSNFPEVQIVVIDDGKHTPQKEAKAYDLRARGHVYEFVPFDSGFGFKSNYAIGKYSREYVLIGSDDFDFATASVREGVEKLYCILNEEPSVAIASGRVNSYPYDYFLDEVEPGHIEEVPLERRGGTVPHITPYSAVYWQPIDMSVNYCLIRRRILGFGERQVHWDDDVKIGGGEHGAFFWDVKQTGHKVAHVPGVNINEQQGVQVTDPNYGNMRRRARDPQRPCFKRRGIIQWGSDYPKPGVKYV